MENMLTEKEIEVIKSALYAHIRQCKDFITLDDKVKTFTSTERANIEDKIDTMGKLLVNI